jgi:hypothetical protein
MDKDSIIKQFKTIPGIGKAMAEDLYTLGYRSVNELADMDAQESYERLSTIQRNKLDRCVLYVFRCAKYFAGTKDKDPELLKWWNWKNREI